MRQLWGCAPASVGQRPTRTGLRLSVGAALLAAAIGLAPAAHADHKETLRLGVVPFADDDRLMRQYRPLIGYLERELDQPVRLRTAPDLRTFVMRLETDAYDVVIAGAHVAALALADYGYTPVVRTTHGINCVLYGVAGRGIDTLERLRGHSVATPGDLSLPAILLERALADRGLRVGRDVTFVHSASNPSALLLAINGKTGAVAALDFVAATMGPDVQTALTPLLTVAPPFAGALVAAPHMAPATTQALRGLMVAFPKTPEGRRYAVLSPGIDLTPVEPADFAPFRVYLPLLRMRLADAAVR